MMARDVYTQNNARSNFRLFCPDERTQTVDDVFEVENRVSSAATLLSMITSTHGARHGGTQRAPLRRLARGLPANRATRRVRDLEAFAMISASMTVQHTKWLEAARELPWRDRSPRSISC